MSWIANALAPSREGANAYVYGVGPPYSREEKEKLGIERKESDDSQTTESSSPSTTSTSNAHLSAAPSRTENSHGGISQVYQASPSTTEIRRVSGQFNAPTEAEIRKTKNDKGWRQKWQKLRDYQHPEKR